MDRFKGRIILFHQDQSLLINPPCTYAEFVEDDSIWSKFDSASDLAWKKYCQEYRFGFLDEFEDDFLDKGFRVLPMNPQVRELVTPKLSYPQHFSSVEMNPVTFWGIDYLTTHYTLLCSVLVERSIYHAYLNLKGNEG